MACIKKRGKRWYARIHRSGQYKAKSFTARLDAERWAREQDICFDRQEAVRPNDTDGVKYLDDLLARYKTEVTPQKRGAKAESYRIEVLRRHRIAKMRPSEIRPSTIAQYRDERLQLVANNTVKNEINLLSAVFEHARTEWDIGSTNPTKGLKRPKDNSPRKKMPTPAQLTALLAYTASSRSSNLHHLVVLALETAARLGELIQIRLEDIDVAQRRITLVSTKNGHSRLLPLSDKSLELVTQRLNGNRLCERLFDCSADSIKHSFKDAARRAGIGWISFHTLRHIAVTRLLESGLGVSQVAQISGHRTLNVIARYAHHDHKMAIWPMQLSKFDRSE
jgi:integrase